jgi:hypothetical protein
MRFDKKVNGPGFFAAEEHVPNVMHAVRTFVVAALMATAGWMPTCAAERVDLLLVLAADVSGSVDESKFDLQRSGYAAALPTSLHNTGYQATSLSHQRDDWS